MGHFTKPKSQLFANNYPSEPSQVISASEDLKSICAGYLGVKTTINNFFKIVQASGIDRHCFYREDFWLSYLNSGYLHRAWIIISPNLKGVASSRYQMKPHQFALLSCDPNYQALNSVVLLMNIGNLIITEWGHVGKCRFWSKSNIKAPSFYKSHYSFEELSSGSNYTQQDFFVKSGLWQKDISSWMKAKANIPIPLKISKNMPKL